MPPRFMQRINRNSETLKAVFGEPGHENEPPPYASARTSIASSSASSSTMTSSTAATRNSALTASPPPRYNVSPQQQEPQQHSQPLPVLDEVLAIPVNSLILVTGANSFQGMHIADQLLAHGYRVRGTVRDETKAAWTTKYFDSKYTPGRYTAVLVPEMEMQGSFHAAIRSCSGVVHVASVTDPCPDPNKVITPTIAGAINALEAAASEPKVVRVVYTSSVAATLPCERTAGFQIATHTWNMEDFHVAWAPPPFERGRLLAVRSSAKMQTEAAVWRWHEVHQPEFAINTVLPDILWGRLLTPEQRNYSLSVEILRAIYREAVPYFPPAHFINVQDSALLHLAALLLPDVQSQRIFAVGQSWSAATLVDVMKKLFPKLQVRDEPRGRETEVDRTVFREAGVAEGLLRRMGRGKWVDLGTSVEETCEAFVG